MLNYLISFTERWLGAFPRVLLTFIGVLVCVLVIGAVWDRRMKTSIAVIGFLAGLGIVFNSVIFNILNTSEVDQRFKIFLAALGLLVLFITIQAMRTSGLQRRYAVIWLVSGTVLLLTATSPTFLHSLEVLSGIRSCLLIVSGAVIFLLLLVFHFSIVRTRLEKQRLLLELDCNSLETKMDGLNLNETDKEQPVMALPDGFMGQGGKAEKKSSIFSVDTVGRAIRGTRIGAPLVIFLVSLSVLFVGLAAPQAMVGDEVTHYYMLVKQAQNISKPNFYSDIPMATGGIETRRYPHSFGWHYLGALVFLLTGGSFAGVQLYQTFFLFQLLAVAYMLARSRGGVESRSALLYVLTLASLPLCLIFSVAFYQDVPMTAQVLTAFFLLNRRNWLMASFFMALAIAFKVTAILFFPAFFFLVLFWETRKGGFKQGIFALICTSLIVLGSTWALGKAINIYGQAAFYPQEKLEILATVIKDQFTGLVSGREQGTTVAQIVEKKRIASTRYMKDKSLETAPVVIANNPGDLRIKENYLVYGGLLIWLILLAGGIASLPLLKKRQTLLLNYSNIWLFGVGGSFLVMTAYLIKTAPDARFFLPGLPFVLLPIVERVVNLPKPKLLITLFTALALLQSGYVLNKTYRLRVVSPGIYEGINYLKAHPPTPKKIFMYPEGNYRLFPLQHEWYLGFRLREFWRAKNDKRIEILQQFAIGAIVIKKHLIASVDKEITNLGVYPTQFVDDLKNDSRFVKIFENKDLLILRPPVSQKLQKK